MEKRIELGAQVWAKDGGAGTVDKIVADPEGHRPGYLVVKRGRVQPREIVVPASLVQDVTPSGVTVATTRKALDQFPDYEVTVRQGEYRRPVAVGGPRPVKAYTPANNQGYVVLRQRSVPDTSIGVEQGMEVLDTTGLKIGNIQGLVLDGESRQATHLVLRQSGPLAWQQWLVPVDLVADVGAGRVHLHISLEHVAGLARYAPAPEDNPVE